MPGLQGPILGLMEPIPGSRANPMFGKCPLNVKRAKTTTFHFWRGPTRPGDPFMVNFTPVARALPMPLPPLTQPRHSVFQSHIPAVSGS